MSARILNAFSLPGASLAACVLAAQPCVAGTDYEASIRAVTGLLRSGQPAQAETELVALEPDYPDNPEVEGLLASALEAQGKLPEAAALADAMLARWPELPGLRVQRERIGTALDLAEVRRLRASGQLPAARAGAQSLYDSGRAGYEAGLLLAQLHAALREPAKAAAVYAQLARRYPQDPELAVSRVRALVDAREPQAARIEYEKLPAGTRALADRTLGDARNALYYDSLTAWGLGASSSSPYPSDTGGGLLLAERVARGTLTLSAETDHRFGEQAQQYGAGYEFPLPRTWGAYVGGTFSPQRTFLASSAFTLTVDRSWSRAMGYLTLAQLDFAHSSAFVVAPGATLYGAGNWSLDGRLYWVPSTHAHTLMLAPQWRDARGDRVRLTLSAGMAGEDLGIAGGTLRSPGQAVRIDGTWRVNQRWGINAAAFHEHRERLYDRSGATLGATAWW
jgi:YaiO family outer membrane protein